MSTNLLIIVARKHITRKKIQIEYVTMNEYLSMNRETRGLDLSWW